MIKKIIIDGQDGSRIILQKIAPDTKLSLKALYSEEASGNDIYTGDDTLLKIICYDVQYFSELRKMMITGIKAKITIVGDKNTLVWSNYIDFIVGQKIKSRRESKTQMLLDFQMKDNLHGISYEITENESTEEEVSGEPTSESQQIYYIKTLSGTQLYTLKGDAICRK